MGRKVFVSYKHCDDRVEPLGKYGDTARAYVDHLMENSLDDEIYKGEGNEDLSEFKNDTIKNRLKEKIHDSSITLVLISPGMKDGCKKESDQWIPWEISYSLKEITRGDKLSHSNGVLAIVLPDRSGSYGYYISYRACAECHVRQLDTGNLFQILRENMFNYRDGQRETCDCCGCSYYRGDSSYIESVKWCDFLSNKDHYLDRAASIRDNRKSYNIVKEIVD